MSEYEALEAVVATMTPRQWYDIARADEDGPLGPCCASISELRTQMLAFLRSPMITGAMELAQALTGGGHEFDGPIVVFSDALVAHLDKRRPGWRTEELPDDDDLAELMAWGSLGIRQPYEPVGVKPPTEWLPALSAALQEIAAHPGEAPNAVAMSWLIGIQERLAVALLAGAPAQVCMSALDVARRVAYVRTPARS